MKLTFFDLYFYVLWFNTGLLLVFKKIMTVSLVEFVVKSEIKYLHLMNLKLFLSIKKRHLALIVPSMVQAMSL